MIMPRWISELYNWIIKEGYSIDDMICYKIKGQKGKRCFRPKVSKADLNDDRFRYLYVGLEYEMSLRAFVERKIEFRNRGDSSVG